MTQARIKKTYALRIYEMEGLTKIKIKIGSYHIIPKYLLEQGTRGLCYIDNMEFDHQIFHRFDCCLLLIEIFFVFLVKIFLFILFNLKMKVSTANQISPSLLSPSPFSLLFLFLLSLSASTS